MAQQTKLTPVEWELMEIGLKIGITSNINQNGMITASIQVEESYVASVVKTSGGEMPVFRTRSSKSMCRLGEGQTFVLTGFSGMRHHDEDHIVCVFIDFTING